MNESTVVATFNKQFLKMPKWTEEEIGAIPSLPRGQLWSASK